MTNQLARFPIPIPTSLRLALALVVVVMFAWLVDSSAAASFTVTNTNDSGAGSLRQAILDANGSEPRRVGDDNIVSNRAAAKKKLERRVAQILETDRYRNCRP